MKAYKLLDAGLNCRTTRKEECDVVFACLELVVRDLRQLFGLFHEKLLWVVKEDETGDIFKGWEKAEVRAVLAHFKNFYNDRFDSIQSFLVEIGEILEVSVCVRVCVRECVCMYCMYVLYVCVCA